MNESLNSGFTCYLTIIYKETLNIYFAQEQKKIYNLKKQLNLNTIQTLQYNTAISNASMKVVYTWL